MSSIVIDERVHWSLWTDEVIDLPAVMASEVLVFTSTGSPAEHVGAAIVDDFADDLRRLADA
jgi:hypothetical protein